MRYCCLASNVCIRVLIVSKGIVADLVHTGQPGAPEQADSGKRTVYCNDTCCSAKQKRHSCRQLFAWPRASLHYGFQGRITREADCGVCALTHHYREQTTEAILSGKKVDWGKKGLPVDTEYTFFAYDRSCSMRQVAVAWICRPLVVYELGSAYRYSASAIANALCGPTLSFLTVSPQRPLP